MAIREDLVASAAQFLQDPTVVSSPVQSKVSFLRSKNLTDEEIDVALARGATGPEPAMSDASFAPAHTANPYQHYQPYPRHAWQPQPPVARRDWRDWFIMATVVSGLGYSLYSLGKRYVYPLVAPPTPDRLEQDKKLIEEQFNKAFTLVEQLAKDTEELKAAEQKRTERLDVALKELETVTNDLKLANRRREDDGLRVRDEVQALKDSVPRAMDSHKDVLERRLSEINSELVSLKTLVTQRMTAAAKASSSDSNTQPTPAGHLNGTGRSPTRGIDPPADKPNSVATTQRQNLSGHPGGPVNGARPKASIPAWQMAAASKSTADSSLPTAVVSESGGSESKKEKAAKEGESGGGIGSSS